MESKFKMVTHHNSDNLHIKLTGDFDTLAAETLMKAIQRDYKKFKKIFIYTNCLNSVEPAGMQAFQQGYNVPFDGMNSIVFTGEHAGHIAPYAWQVM
jgi:hypothetical protein